MYDHQPHRPASHHARAYSQFRSYMLSLSLFAEFRPRYRARAPCPLYLFYLPFLPVSHRPLAPFYPAHIVPLLIPTNPLLKLPRTVEQGKSYRYHLEIHFGNSDKLGYPGNRGEVGVRIDTGGWHCLRILWRRVYMSRREVQSRSDPLENRMSSASNRYVAISPSDHLDAKVDFTLDIVGLKHLGDWSNEVQNYGRPAYILEDALTYPLRRYMSLYDFGLEKEAH